MSSAITETDTYPATITGPDAGDAITAASVRTMGQGLANRTLNHENRLDDAEAAISDLETADTELGKATIGRWNPSASALASGGTLSLAMTYQSPISGSWSTSSDQVQVPSAGVYRVAVRIVAYPASAVAGVTIDVMVGASQYKQCYSPEPGGATNDESVIVSGETVFPISTPASQKIWLKNLTGVAISTTTDASAIVHDLVIERMGDIS